MKHFFYPRSVAVIGVSEKESNLARNIVKNCLEFGFKGDIFGVGKKAGRILGIPIFTSIESLPEGIDLAVILTPAETIAGIMTELGKIGVQWIIIETGGFSEFDPRRQKLEAEILKVARRYNQRLIGPNCLGVINMETGLCTPFAPYRRDMRTGGVSIISQSGGMGRTFFSILESEGIGLNKFVSVGNKLDVGEAELLRYFLADSATGIVFLYLEDLREGRDFLAAAYNSDKPILVYKANRGRMGSSIALSHTKALATDDHVVEAALDEAGIIRIGKTYELGKALKAFHMPALKGPNLIVISRSGGHAVVAADACEMEGLCLPPLASELKGKLKKHLRANVIRLQNPLDMGDVYDFDVFLMAIEEAMEQESIHGVLFVLVYPEFVNAQHVRRMIPYLEQFMRRYQKPIAATFISSPGELKKLREEFSLPIFSSSEEAVEALAISYHHHRLKKIRKAVSTGFQVYPSSHIEETLKKPSRRQRNLLLHESLEVLVMNGFPVAPYKFVQNVTQAVNFARDFGFPVVLKMVSREILHKSKHDGVRLDINTFSGIRRAFLEMKRKIVDQGLEDQEWGLVIQKMVPAGQEVILGARRDPNFGPVVVFGLGGIFTEVFKDVAIRLAPLDELRAREMIKQVKSIPAFTGTDKKGRVDFKLIEECLLKVSDLIMTQEKIAELDINPLILYPHGGHIVDARIILR